MFLLALLVACVEPEPTDTDDSTIDDTDPDTEPVPIEEIDSTTLPQGPSPCADPILVDITYVTDGDTVYAEPSAGGAELNVRLIGFDTPEVAHYGDPAECWGDDAKAYAQEVLGGARAWLTFDAECQDYYGRTLGYLHLGQEEHDFFNWHMVRQGHGTVMTIEPNDTFAADFEAAQSAARSEDLAYWGECR